MIGADAGRPSLSQVMSGLIKRSQSITDSGSPCRKPLCTLKAVAGADSGTTSRTDVNASMSILKAKLMKDSGNPALRYARDLEWELTLSNAASTSARQLHISFSGWSFASSRAALKRRRASCAPPVPPYCFLAHNGWGAETTSKLS